MRSRLSVFALVIGFFSALVAGPLVYVSTVIDDEDAFVAVTGEVIEHPETRRVVASVLSDAVATSISENETLTSDLPPQVRMLVVPVSKLATNQLAASGYDLLGTDAVARVRDSALRTLHAQVTADVDRVAIDLRAVLVAAARDLAGPAGGGAVAKLMVDKDLGTYTVAEPGSKNAAVFDVIRSLPDLAGLVALVMLTALIAAVLIAPDRRQALTRVGLCLAGAAFVSTMVVAGALEGLVGSQGPVGRAVVDVVGSDFGAQERGSMISGLVIATIGLLLSNRSSARALRRLPVALWKHDRAVVGHLEELVGDNAPLARMFVWLAGATTLGTWSGRTPRVVLTIIGLTLVGQALVFVMTSGSPWATRLRRRLGLGPLPVQHSAPLRTNLIWVVALVTLFWPRWGWSLAARTFVVLALVLAAVEAPGAVRLARAGRRPDPVAHKPSRRRVTFALAGVAATLVIAVAATAGARESVAESLACNGSEELCDRPLTEVVLAGSHNSMSSSELGWDLAMQTGDVVAQLDHGVRALLIDTHYWATKGDYEGDETAAKETIEAALSTSSKPQPGVWLCHGFCALGASDAVSVFAEIRAWMDSHPREVVVIVVEDAVTAADTEDVFRRSGLLDLAHVQEPGQPWPTLRTMIDSGKRLVVFSEKGGAAGTWNQNAWSSGGITETPFDFPVAAAFSCARNRGEEDASFFMVNHWLTTGLPVPGVAVSVNSREAIVKRVRSCEQERGRRVSIVAVDFAQTGDLIGAVAVLNGIG